MFNKQLANADPLGMGGGMGGGDGLNMIRQLLQGQQGQQGFAPSQTAQMMMGQQGARARGGGFNPNISIEPPILSQNRLQNRILQADRNDMYGDQRTANWIYHLMYNPSFWGSSVPGGIAGATVGGPIGGALGMMAPITGDVNLLGGSHHFPPKKTK
jgi:hypothetical protein